MATKAITENNVQEQTTAVPEEPKQDIQIAEKSEALAKGTANQIPFGVGGLTPTTFQEAWSFANALAKSTIVPDRFRNKPADCFIAMEYAANLRVPTLTLMKHFMVVNGSPAIWGDLMLAIVMNHPQYEYHKRFTRGSGDQREGVFEIKRKGHELHIQTFSVADAKRAELWLNPKKDPWLKYGERMLEWRAQGWGCRDKFPDALCGLISVEEARDIPAGPTIEAENETQEVVDTLIPLRAEIADFYKTKLLTDGDGKRYNDARIAVLLGACRTASDLQGIYDAGKAELVRRTSVTVYDTKVADPSVVAQETPVETAKPDASTQPPQKTEHGYRDMRTAVKADIREPSCPNCERLKSKCFDCIQKEKEERIQKFKSIVAELTDLLGRDPQGPPTVKQFEGMGRVPQEQEIAKAEQYLAKVKEDDAPKETKGTLFER
jgi:hypothetical protein